MPQMFIRKSVVNCQEHQCLVCSRLCSLWCVHKCLNCCMFTHATNAERPDDDKILVNSKLLVSILVI